MPPRKKIAAERIQSRGRTRMKELGMKKVEVWFDERELAIVASAAAEVRKKVAAWVRQQAFHAAQAASLQRARDARRERNDPSN